ncbi:hypothetical protein [Hoeflea sp.]|uniref:hypothetical protein n=1 Tax=Hoeflea sp. TaxID=1940281 RepID=UPI003B0281F8
MSFRWSALILLVFLLPALTACNTGIAEFQLYEQAYGQQAAEADKVLDRLASAERIVARRSDPSLTRVFDFDPDKAAYYVDAGDPPLTAAIRAGLNSVTTYNAMLAGLANGENANALASRAGTLYSNLLATTEALSIAAGLPTAFVPGAQALAGRLLPLFEQAQKLRDRAAFRRKLLEAYPDMRALLVRLRNGTREMYTVIQCSYVKRGVIRNRGIPAADVPKLEADRKLLAGWVILMDQTLVSMDAATQAVLAGASPTDASALLDASVELRVLAERVRDATRPQ